MATEEELIYRDIFLSYAKQIRTAIPATVIEFNPKTQRIKAEIDILEQIGEEYLKPAILEDVPVSFPRVKNFMITLPLEKGDKILLIFAESSIDKWLIDGSSNNFDTRMHSINDAIAIMDTPYPENNPILDFDEDALTLRKANNAIYLKIKDDGIEIKGKLMIIGDVQVLGKIIATDVIASLRGMITKWISYIYKA